MQLLVLVVKVLYCRFPILGNNRFDHTYFIKTECFHNFLFAKFMVYIRRYTVLKRLYTHWNCVCYCSIHIKSNDLKHYILSPLILRITLHGLPTASEFSGISFVTTLPAPITEPSPIVTPGRTITPPPSQQPFPIFIGNA